MGIWHPDLWLAEEVVRVLECSLRLCAVFETTHVIATAQFLRRMTSAPPPPPKIAPRSKPKPHLVPSLGSYTASILCDKKPSGLNRSKGSCLSSTQTNLHMNFPLPLASAPLPTLQPQVGDLGDNCPGGSHHYAHDGVSGPPLANGNPAAVMHKLWWKAAAPHAANRATVASCFTYFSLGSSLVTRFQLQQALLLPVFNNIPLLHDSISSHHHCMRLVAEIHL